MKRYQSYLLVVAGLLGISSLSCGLREPTYIDYKESELDEATCAAGLTAFADSMAEAVDNTCAGSSCHAATEINGNTLIPKDNEKNRKVLLAYTKSDANTLFALISDKDAHKGGDMTAILPLANIESWVTAEAGCAN